MGILSEILGHNRDFIARREYESFRTDRFPNKKLVVLTCMDTRLVELLPRAMGFGQGDAKVLKTAGAVVSHPFGSIMRSILIAIYELDATDIAVVGHHGCGMAGLCCERILDKARERGISDDTLQTLKHSGIDLTQWLAGFESVRDSVLQSVSVIRHHPLLPKDVHVHGMLICPDTGAIEVVVDGEARG